jgi:hypothetical protein
MNKCSQEHISLRRQAICGVEWTGGSPCFLDMTKPQLCL